MSVDTLGMFEGGTLGLPMPDDVYGTGGGGYPTGGSSGGWGGDDWRHLIDRGFNAASQIFSAWGRRATQQTGPGGIPIGGGYTPEAYNRSMAEIRAAEAAALAAARNNANDASRNPAGRNSLDNIFGNLTQTIQDNPMIFAAGAVGLYLLFRDPPRSRR